MPSTIDCRNNARTCSRNPIFARSAFVGEKGRKNRQQEHTFCRNSTAPFLDMTYCFIGSELILSFW